MPTHCGCDDEQVDDYCTWCGAGPWAHADHGESLTVASFGYLAGAGLLIMPTPATSMTSGDLGRAEFSVMKIVVPGAGLEPA